MATKTSIPSSQSPKLSRLRPQYIPNHIPDSSYVRILDTTLRDGEQSPGATMTAKEKLDIARQLVKLGVDIIQPGFPSASNSDFMAVKMIAQEVGNAVGDDGYVPVIASFCRCVEKDIATAWEAVKYAKRPRLCTSIATSPIHMEHKLRKSKDQVIQIARDMVKFARSLGCNDIQFGAEDATSYAFGTLALKRNRKNVEEMWWALGTHLDPNILFLSNPNIRSDREFLYEILGVVIEAGATTVNIADTVGIVMPLELGKLIVDIKDNTPGIANVIISTHCHNDLGLATANTIEGARTGARQLEVTINGIGERAGNASLEEIFEDSGEVNGSIDANTLDIFSGLEETGDRLTENWRPALLLLEIAFLQRWTLGFCHNQPLMNFNLVVGKRGFKMCEVKLTPGLVPESLYLPHIGLSTQIIIVSSCKPTRSHTKDHVQQCLMSHLPVEEYSGMHLQPHKPLVGANAFVHASGIHQDGMLKHKGTYETISPEEIGHKRTTRIGIVLGKLRYANYFFSQICLC
ncbi:hypothetical protein JHK82_031103 [Glycine max]|nr:hypothetical protein JHK85_031750 [Glycine max]KAG5124366.1 hypothetical protein JHK82_031103 [Glycine max]